ncbi:phosphotransferase [Aeromicrobium duanguangcaii]|uniref:Aminoglycoside phosphotransferase family protein n=1 Tax=Aeromicrobium duanguangcaii TaxID=2968086 RepID=A0ABY5KE85_9ACTN|nr:phosphotransferase [Aeromicrobium duanguangcaii]MCD9154324.1 aminoglycoside phosphotransferase family protein [Aeromicrobium duanguangcaii]MCL3838070.1 aminoglycoside phosphotransferase family protein [Aeromicrobium duanguangcaii]UUI68609.1 aminoglycoside phosphotransferase family protein [Aeromicrobium duanguangcaii]
MVHEPFSTQVATPQWRTGAQEWIRASLADRGIAVTGAVEQPRIRPWSTQLTVPTDRGTVWFKAACPSMSFEPALQQALARLVPGSVQDPLAVEPDRGWMLTLDHGPTLADQRTATLDDWRRALTEAARVQRALVPHRAELLATGLPDAGPETVVDRFDRLLQIHEHQTVGHGAHVAPERIVELRGRRAELVDACAELAESSVPSTWQHGDLHPNNLHENDRIAFFDLGDGMWAHAVEILSVPYGVITDEGSVAWPEVVTAWTEAWELEPAEFDRLWRASALTHAVNRAVTWHRALLTATAAEIDEWGDAVEHHLASMLDV